MGRKLKNKDEKKVTITLRLTYKLVQLLRKRKGYNQLVEELLWKYFKDDGTV